LGLHSIEIRFQDGHEQNPLPGFAILTMLNDPTRQVPTLPHIQDHAARYEEVDAGRYIDRGIFTQPQLKGSHSDWGHHLLKNLGAPQDVTNL
jgi:hypothetical protein